MVLIHLLYLNTCPTILRRYCLCHLSERNFCLFAVMFLFTVDSSMGSFDKHFSNPYIIHSIISSRKYKSLTHPLRILEYYQHMRWCTYKTSYLLSTFLFQQTSPCVYYTLLCWVVHKLGVNCLKIVEDRYLENYQLFFFH